MTTRDVDGALLEGFGPSSRNAFRTIPVEVGGVRRGTVEVFSKRYKRPHEVVIPMAVALVVLWGLSGLLARRLARPLADLASTAAAIGRGELDRRTGGAPRPARGGAGRRGHRRHGVAHPAADGRSARAARRGLPRGAIAAGAHPPAGGDRPARRRRAGARAHRDRPRGGGDRRAGGPGLGDDADKLFLAFHRKAGTHGALGLGLAIVARIAEAHGGGAYAEDRAEGGARIGFWIPGDARATSSMENAATPLPEEGVQTIRGAKSAGVLARP